MKIFKSIKLWCGLFALLIAAIAVLSIMYPCWLEVFWDWLRGGMVTQGETINTTTESNSTTIRNVGLVVGGIVAIVLAVWRSRVAERQANAAQQQADLAQRGLLNERYQKGAEMLGSEVLAVRMGGIYTLQRLSEEHPKEYHIQIMSLLCAFVRNPTKDNRIDEKQDKQAQILRADVQDIMQAIGSRNPESISLERSEDFKLYLRGANMSHLQARDARLSGAWLTKANLSGAVLPYADLSSTRLRQANLSDVRFRHADLSDAKFWGANLSKAILRDANLSGADLCGIDAHSPAYKQPVCGLTQVQLDEACADPDNPPKLDGLLDAETGEPLVWPASRLRTSSE